MPKTITVEQREHLLRQVARIRLAGSEFAGEFWSLANDGQDLVNDIAFDQLADLTEELEKIVKRQPVKPE